jgi:hypothetical protein
MAKDLGARLSGDDHKRGAGLVELVAGLEHLDDDEVLDVLVSLQRAQSRLAWAEQQALVRLAGPSQRTHEVLVHDRRLDAERVVEVTDEVRDEIAAALHRSANLVHDQITSARLLNGPLADTAHALRDGQITPAHARMIVEQVRRLDGAVHCANVDPGRDTPAQAEVRAAFRRVCAQLQARVLPGAARQTPAQTRAHARRAMAVIDAEGEARRRAAARGTRDVWISPDDDGIATLIARLDAVTAHAIRTAIDTAAADPTLTGDSTATIGERRADALAALVLGQAQVSVQVEVTMPASALGITTDTSTGTGTGTVDTGTIGSSAALPDGTLVDTHDIARLLHDTAAAMQLRRLLTDPITGTALDLGRTRYEISNPLRRWITTRDRTCRFPGCRRRATTCQIDHIRPWDRGGATDADNLHPLCHRHHQLKTHCGWQVSRDPQTGRTTWTSPLGRTYTVDPEPVLPPESGPPPPEEPLPF